MKSFVRTAAVAAALCFVSELGALQAFAQSAPAGAPSAESLDLARHYIKAAQLEESVRLTLKVITPQIFDAYMKARKDLSADRRERISKAIYQAAGGAESTFLMKYFEKMTVVVAETYTPAELRRAIEYYESPEGRSFLKKSPLFLQRTQDVMRTLMPEFQADLAARVKAQLDEGNTEGSHK